MSRLIHKPEEEQEVAQRLQGPERPGQVTVVQMIRADHARHAHTPKGQKALLNFTDARLGWNVLPIRELVG